MLSGIVQQIVGDKEFAWVKLWERYVGVRLHYNLVCGGGMALVEHVSLLALKSMQSQLAISYEKNKKKRQLNSDRSVSMAE